MRLRPYLSQLILLCIIAAIPVFSITRLIAADPNAASDAATNAGPLKGLEWRMVGPWRGGRVTTVTGVPGKPWLYYMGATGGGVWKTENSGTTWENISDGFFKVGTIGAVAVSESDNNVLYVGTGEAPIRGVTTAVGDGVYKSVDAGQTWTHIGLDKAGQISKIEINPSNPDIAAGVEGQCQYRRLRPGHGPHQPAYSLRGDVASRSYSLVYPVRQHRWRNFQIH